MSQNLRDLMNECCETYAENTAVRVLRQSDQTGDKGLAYVPITYRQLKEQRDRVAGGLVQMGVEKGQRVGTLTDGGLEPLLVFLACDAIGASAVPLCNKLPDDILVHNIDHARLATLFVDARSREQMDRVHPRLEHKPELVLTEGSDPVHKTFFDVVQAGRDITVPDREILPGDESKVVFTSGSSGLPKGVIQTHENLVANVTSVRDKIWDRPDTILFKSAPDYHTLGILNIYFPLSKGWTLDLARSPDRVLVDLRYSEPHAFLTVPLVLDKVYGNVRKEIEKGGARGRLIARAVKAKQRISRGEGTIGDKLVFKTLGKKVVAQIKAKLSARVGDRMEVMIVGAAKADPDALDFFHDVLDITTFEGYGTTECAPLIAANHQEGRRVGTVGRPLIEVKLVTEDGSEVAHGDPSTGTYRGNPVGVGELWASGRHVMRGYLDDPEQRGGALVTDEAGKVWYRTGDLFSMDEEGFLTFRGRLGRQFKLKNGEFVNPEQLERIYANIPLVEHVLVCGDQTRTFPLPIVTVNVEEARLLGIADLPDDDEEVRKHPEVVSRAQEALQKEATRAGLPGHERPQRILVLPSALSEETGTLTRGMKKIAYKAVVEQHKELIDHTYDD